MLVHEMQLRTDYHTWDDYQDQTSWNGFAWAANENVVYLPESETSHRSVGLSICRKSLLLPNGAWEGLRRRMCKRGGRHWNAESSNGQNIIFLLSHRTDIWCSAQNNEIRAAIPLLGPSFRKILNRWSFTDWAWVEMLLVSICVSFSWVSFKTHQLWGPDIQKENIKQAKGNDWSHYKSTAANFSSRKLFQTGGKNSSSTSVLTAFISFGLFNIFLLDV